ncbi:MAG: electron transport complex subunit RsxG [Woeseiaceae bacterium]|nr:electron transport complex subunit RsxG [Woeseiaceae bacterium]
MSTSSIFRTGLTLAAIGAICTMLVAATYQATRDRIAANDKALLEQSLLPALAGIDYDSGLTDSLLELQPPHELPGNDTALVYRVFAAGEPAAALFAVTARDGYSGPIRVLIGVAYDGTVSGVRILQHRETPGLGDMIDSSRSDWVLQFDGRSLGNPAAEHWAIRGDGGEFDQLTGASITPRAVVGAVRDTLLYFDAHRDEIFPVAASEENE